MIFDLSMEVRIIDYKYSMEAYLINWHLRRIKMVVNTNNTTTNNTTTTTAIITTTTTTTTTSVLI